ncbi:FAD-binding oxidoreductase [Noviherbaspirillum sp. Root189]|uniref:FAD-binding oxidoreductase n=1 Tax=Noviherbaspirillum sp. Root189 TaxID=1736487 RepID=UPI00070D0628|nr:FAD-binding oxidoreductase [Noviherbaspirillum sp. Root189]KRB88955.1 FAD-linked oxidase [Noviherbaspirillum sp. Root189]
MKRISSWGRLGEFPHEVVELSDRSSVPDVLVSKRPGLAYGMGRSYGDSCLNPDGILWITTGLDRFIEFNRQTGRLVCEAGVLLRDIQKLTIPQGWILPTTPGTQLLTVGGAIANDIHGKNHHAVGSFGNHLHRIRLVRTDGEIIECGPERLSAWFAATVGGLGLTGVIVEAEIQLKRVASPWLDTESIPFGNLDDFFSLSDASEAEWEHTVSWIDCLSGTESRGLFMRGRHIDAKIPEPRKSRSFSMPFVPPVSLVNRLSLRPFNSAYFTLKKMKAGRQTAHYESFFYPLDNLLHWNRMYGPKGFYQYQSVVPRTAGKLPIHAMLKEIARSGEGSFLAVLKTFGHRQSLGMLSFPQPGVTLALDFPNNGEKTLKLFDRLDAIVRDSGGRLYPAKDARMPRDLFESGYPRHIEFMQYRDPGISSALSRRLMGY